MLYPGSTVIVHPGEVNIILVSFYTGKVQIVVVLKNLEDRITYNDTNSITFNQKVGESLPP